MDLSRARTEPVIAEGVATVEQLNLLCQFGCHKAQAYLFGKPVSGERFVANIKSNPKDRQPALNP